MKDTNLIRRALRSILIVAACAAAPSIAQVNFNIVIAPPAPQYEPVPQLAQGYVWAPGYWAWHGDRHIWVRGRTIAQRVGYVWEPDRWEERDRAYYRQPGGWKRDPGYQVVKMKKPKKSKHRDDDDDDHGGNHGKRGR